MKLRALRLHDVRRFGGRGAALEGFGDGLNVFAEPNETGKSTFFDALHALLFEKHGSSRKPIRALRPYAGGAPRIAADIETTAGLHRIEKRFLSRPFASVRDLATGREIARDDAAQAWILSAIGADREERGPAGLLWVRQGESRDLEKGRDGREQALSGVVEDQLDEMTGGGRMRAARRRVKEELDALATPTGQPKAGGAWREARDAVAALTEEAARLRAEAAAHGADLAARARLRRRARAMTAEAEAGDDPAARLAGAERALEEARVRAGAAERMAAAATLAQRSFERAEERLHAFTEQRGAALDAAARLDAAEAAAPAPLAAEAREIAAMRGAETVAAEAERAAETAAAALDAARKAREARRAGTERDRLAAALAAAEAKQAALGAARRAAARITADREAVEAVEALTAELDAVRIAADSAAATIEIAYAPGGEGRAVLDGAPLAGGARQPIRTRAEIRLEGIGTLTLDPGAAGDAGGLSEQARRLEEGVRAALAAHGAADLAALRAAAERRRDLGREAAALEQALAAEAPEGLDALRGAVETLAAAAAAAQPGSETGVDAPAAEARDAEARTAAAEARGALAAARERLDSARQRAEAARLALGTARAARDAARAALPPEADWARTGGALATEREEAQAALDAARRALAEHDGAAEALALAEARRKRLGEAAAARLAEAETLTRDLAHVDGRLAAAESAGVEEQLSEVTGALAAAEARLVRIARDVGALRALGAALETASASVREAYFEPVRAELHPLIRAVLGGEGVGFSGEKLAPETLTRDGLEEDIGVLSGGTQEQIAILARLAFARLLAKAGTPAPVILDDALVYSDDDRIERMFDVLAGETRMLQIIVFTCRQRAFAGLGGAALKLTDWVPED